MQVPSVLFLRTPGEGKESWTGVGAFIAHTGQSNSQLCHFPGLPGHTAAGMPASVSRGELGGRGNRDINQITEDSRSYSRSSHIIFPKLKNNAMKTPGLLIFREAVFDFPHFLKSNIKVLTRTFLLLLE